MRTAQALAMLLTPLVTVLVWAALGYPGLPLLTASLCVPAGTAQAAPVLATPIPTATLVVGEAQIGDELLGIDPDDTYPLLIVALGPDWITVTHEGRLERLPRGRPWLLWQSLDEYVR